MTREHGSESALVHHLRTMAQNNLWSNHRLLGACARLSETEYVAERTSFFPSIHLTLNHILTVDWYYLDALVGGGRGPALYEDPAPFARFDELRVEQERTDRRLLAFCDTLDETSASATVILVRGPEEQYRETASAVLGHLFLHQIHHRGQVHAMLSGTSIEPPQLDEFFLEQDRPLRAAELVELGLPTEPVRQSGDSSTSRIARSGQATTQRPHA
jgi:uncharacterized damage-inducible protein DinB